MLIASAVSPTSGSIHISPKPVAKNPNSNPFSPLSPELHRLGLQYQGSDGEDLQMHSDSNQHNSTEALKRRKMGPVIYYTRERLLKIASRRRMTEWTVPAGMGGLESWFG